MYHIFKTELKRKFKNPVLWILMLMIIVILYINIERSYETNEMDIILSYQPGINTLSKDEYYTDSMKESDFGKDYEDYISRFDNGESLSFYNLNLHNYELGKKAYLEKDIKEDNRIDAYSSLLYANYYANSIKNPNSALSKFVCQIANKELWDEVSNGIKYEDIDFTNKSNFNLYNVISTVFAARYNYYLYCNNLSPIENNEFNNLYVLYDWMHNIIPIVIIVIIILLNYDLINKDIKEGSIKLLITQSLSRWKYYLAKFLAGTVVALFALVAPLVISNIYLKTQITTQPLNYPIVYDEQGFFRFKPSFNYMEENFKKYEMYVHKAFYKIPYSKVDESSQFKWPLYQRNVDLIAFNKFILIAFIYLLLFTMFLVAFVQLCSTIFNNVYLNLFATTAIYGVFYILSRPYLYGKHYNLSPFTMNNSARIVAGTHNVTMLTAFLILIFSTIILLFTGIKYFKQKSI